jgi:hypothetical protein
LNSRKFAFRLLDGIKVRGDNENKKSDEIFFRKSNVEFQNRRKNQIKIRKIFQKTRESGSGAGESRDKYKPIIYRQSVQLTRDK